MGVVKTITVGGQGAKPRVGDVVTIEYTGWLKDSSKPGGKGIKWVVFLLLFLRPYSASFTVCMGSGELARFVLLDRSRENYFLQQSAQGKGKGRRLNREEETLFTNVWVLVL